MTYFDHINAAVTICDRTGSIVYMNERSAEVFKNDGGRELIGKSLFDCHPEPALTKVKELLSTGSTNIYTIEKHGKKKLIYQSPWLTNGVLSGMVEISIELPEEMKHFVREEK
ncbi:MAG: PAS domain-containing protein [Bacteroidota bacterium]